MAAEKVTVMTAAKRRLKSGRRAHFTLGNGQPSYNTVTADTFTGRQRNDDNVPAAGKVSINTSTKLPINIAVSRQFPNNNATSTQLPTSIEACRQLSTNDAALLIVVILLSGLQVEKIEKEFNHFFMSDNMEDNLIDPGMPTLQESRTALDNYGHRKKPTDINDKLTVTKTDYLPVSDGTKHVIDGVYIELRTLVIH